MVMKNENQFEIAHLRFPCVDCVCFPICLQAYMERYNFKTAPIFRVDRIEKFHAVNVLKNRCELMFKFIKARDSLFEVTHTEFVADYYIRKSSAYRKEV